VPFGTDNSTERHAMNQAKYISCRLVQHTASMDITPEEKKRAENFDSWQDAIRYHIGLTLDSDIGNFIKLDLQ
jgi:hypothetical protein